MFVGLKMATVSGRNMWPYAAYQQH